MWVLVVAFTTVVAFSPVAEQMYVQIQMQIVVSEAVGISNSLGLVFLLLYYSRAAISSFILLLHIRHTT